MEKRAGLQEIGELQKLTYPTKVFFFQLHVPSSSTEQSSITELLHFPNSPLAFPL